MNLLSLNEIKMLPYNYWNNIQKLSEETTVEAIPGDYVFQFGGVVFLLQRKGDCNNVVCQRVEQSKQSLLVSILCFRLALVDCGVQFIRVEGNLKRYKFLKVVSKRIGGGCNVIQDTERTDRNVFYIRLF